MGDVVRDQKVQLGCGTLIIIALIVLFFSRGDTKEVEQEVRGLRSEVNELRRVIERQSDEIRRLSDRLPTPSAKADAGRDAP
jgi:hypothetical protein